MSSSKKQLSPKQCEDLFKTLQARFEKNMTRHRGLEWARVKAKLEAHPEKLWSLHEMEKTGGEPDVVGEDKKTGAYIFFDCSAQTPSGRVSLCYDDEALESRREHKPKRSALYCDRRYGRVFVGHNGAESYYSGRAFRGSLRV